jgi:hypothetical protein
MRVDPPQILTLKVKVKGVALLVAVDFFGGRDYTSSAGKIRYKTSIISEALNAVNAIIVWFSILEIGGNNWKPSTGYSSITSRRLGLVDTFLASCKWDVVLRGAEQRRAYRRKDFMLDEEANCASDEHVYSEASDRLVELCQT